MSQRRAVLIKIASVTTAILLGITKPTPAFAGTGTVTTAPVPAGATSSSDFSVSANGQSAGVYCAGSNARGNTASFSELDFANGNVTVSIIVNFAFSSYKLVLNSLGLASTCSGNTATLKRAGFSAAPMRAAALG